jgi:hypothetical protein
VLLLVTHERASLMRRFFEGTVPSPQSEKRMGGHFWGSFSARPADDKVASRCSFVPGSFSAASSSAAIQPPNVTWSSSKFGGVMSVAALQIHLVPKRMLDKKEAAAYCGLSIKRFEAECPVQPIRFANSGRFRGACLRWRKSRSKLE